MATQPELFQFTNQAINQVIPQGPALSLRPPPIVAPTSVPAIPSAVSLRPGGVGIPATPTALAPAPAPTVPGVGTSPFVESRSPLGVNISPPTETSPLPAAPAESRVGKAFGIGPNKLGIPEDLDLATLLGSLAQAVGPETVGGRVGGAVAGIRESAKDRELKRIGVESQAEARRGATATAERKAGIAEEKAGREETEVGRKEDLRESISRLNSLPEGAEKEIVRQDIIGLANPDEANLLSNIGIIDKPATGIDTFEIPGRPGEFGRVNRRTNEFITDAAGNIRIVPEPTPPEFGLTSIEGPGGTTGVASFQKRGIGAGPESITRTEFKGAPKRPSALMEQIGLVEKAIKERKGIAGDTSPVTFDDLLKERKEQFTTGKAKSPFLSASEQKAVAAKKNKDSDTKLPTGKKRFKFNKKGELISD